ncbi:MAG: thioredoxin domain-containing protein [Halobacteriota archaeon]
MIKKRTATLAVCAVLLFCVIAAGCTGPTASPTPSTANNSSTNTISSKAISSVNAVTPTATPSATPSATSTITPTAGFSVLFFYEPGCPHCANLENSASFAQLQNKVPVQWISSADTQLNNQHGVSSYPTMILLKNGGIVQSFVGDEDATAILARINAG